VETPEARIYDLEEGESHAHTRARGGERAGSSRWYCAKIFFGTPTPQLRGVLCAMAERAAARALHYPTPFNVCWALLWALLSHREIFFGRKLYLGLAGHRIRADLDAMHLIHSINIS